MNIDYQTRSFLIVDDFPGFRSMLRGMLQMLGAKKIDDAPDGFRALERLAKKKYDVIMCDYNLGEGQDGQGILEEAKFRGLVGYSTAFIMITAENTMKMVMGAVEYKPDDYLTKPFNKGLLKKRLDKVIGKKADLERILYAADKGNYKAAIKYCDVEMLENPKIALEIAKIKGEVCIKAKKYDLAEKIYKKVLSVRPIVWAKLGIGKLCYLRAEYEEAIEILSDLVRENKSLVEAYDLLSMAMLKMGESEKAQQVLMDAVALSPKAIIRQKNLGKIAHTNGDLEVSEKSLKSAVKLGKTSYLQSPNDHFELSKVLLEQNKSDEALKNIAETRKEFRRDKTVGLETRILEAIAFKKKGDDDIAKKIFQDACQDLTNITDEIPRLMVEDMIDACDQFSEKDMSKVLTTAVVDGGESINLASSGALEKFDSLRLNMRGIELYELGKSKEATELFEKAARKLPKHISANMNAAQALLEQVRSSGEKEKPVLKRIRVYLDRAKKIDPSNEKYLKLESMYAQVVS